MPLLPTDADCGLPVSLLTTNAGMFGFMTLIHLSFVGQQLESLETTALGGKQTSKVFTVTNNGSRAGSGLTWCLF